MPISLLLSRPDVILLARLGSVVWYPATALSLALMLAVSPWYFFLACITDTLASALFYQQPFWSFSELFSTIGSNACCLVAACLLRGPLRIDLGLRRQRDVVRYLFVTSVAGLAGSVLGITGLDAGRYTFMERFWARRPGMVFRRRHRTLWGCAFSPHPCVSRHSPEIIWPESMESQPALRTPPPNPSTLAFRLEVIGQACATLLVPLSFSGPDGRRSNSSI